MRAADFDYELPDELIAQEPAARREDSRLLHLPLDGGGPAEYRFADLPGLLEPGDVLVLNDARVLPARLRARRATGAGVELLLLERLDPGGPREDVGRDEGAGRPAAGGEAGERPGDAGERWLALAGPARKARAGEELVVPGPGGAAEAAEVRVRVVEGRAGGRRVLEFPRGCDVEELMRERGSMPLPPYIRRETDDPRAELDRRRYQTVYAGSPGAVAAPTAGLHFTGALLEALDRRGVERATLTLDVGPGTFQPVRADRVEDHEMLPERYRIPAATAAAVASARRRGGRVVAVGTTVVRALEHAAARVVGPGTGPPSDEAVSGEAVSGEADLFITPGHEFRAVDGMVTNFHLPRSTPILMVAAMAGRERLLDAYRLAVERRFRFYSYGDAMLLL